MITIPKHKSVRRLTKRERKAIKFPNAMVMNSLRKGKPQLDGQYRGSVPLFTDVAEHSLIVTTNYIKTTDGVPFVRSDWMGV